MFRRFNIFLTIIFLSVVVAILLLSGWASAQTDVESKTVVSEMLYYRHWLAPIEKINDWPLNDERYVPMRRDLFEELVNSLTATPKESLDTQKNKFVKIVMNAQLKGNQLTNGNGYFEIAQNKSNGQKTQDQNSNNSNSNSKDIHPDRVINLESWNQWINLVQPPTDPNNTNNQTQQNSRLVCTSDGKTLLILPEQNNIRNENSVGENNNEKSNLDVTQLIHFNWSLRGRVNSQGNLQFDVAFPRSLETELNIELPTDKILICSSGVVIEGEVNKQDQNLRNWKILTGTVNNATITITPKNQQQSKKSNTAYRQSILYNISTSGLEVTTTFLFDQNDPDVDLIEVELDAPLVSAAIHSGGVTLPSSFAEQLERKNDTVLRIDLSGFGATRRREITLVALAPIVTSNSRASVTVDDNMWKLPRARIVSKNLFWKETHCSIIIQRPLQTRNVSFSNCEQVRPPVTDMSRSPHDTFELKYFSADSQIGVHIYQEESRINVESFTQIQLNDDSISGTMTVAVSATEGRRFTFAFPISPNWAIHSVRSVYGEEILSWDIVPAKDLKIDIDQNLRNNNIESYLAIQLKKPLGAGDLIRMQIVGRFLTDPHREFKLSEFSPILLSLQKNESHFIAIQTESLSQLQYRLQNSVLFEIRDLTDEKLQQLFYDPPEGVLLPLDVRTQDIAFKTDRARPDYGAEITTKINIGEYNSTATFKFNIKPRETSIERIYVFFPDTNDKTSNTTSPNGVVADNAQQDSQLRHWEISTSATRPDNYRTEILQIAQSRIIKGHELDEFIVAMADRKFPDSFSKGELWELRLSPPQNNPFEVSTTQSITMSDEIVAPFAALPAALAQHGEIYIESDRQFPYAVFCNNLTSIPADISNRQSNRHTRAAFKFDPIESIKLSNKPTLKLQRIETSKVPPEAWTWLMKLESQYGIDGIIKSCANFHIENCGKDLLQIKLPDEISINDVDLVWLDNNQTTWRSVSSQTLAVSIPPYERYITVSVEYSYKNYNQQTVTKISPKYPEIDIPVLSKSFAVWFHPDYKIINSSNKLNVLTFFGSDIANITDYLFGQNKNQHKAKLALQSFNEWMSQLSGEHLEVTWQVLLGDENRFNELLLQKIKSELGNDVYDLPDVRFYVDMLGFAERGITPKSVVAAKNSMSQASICNGLTMFISIETAADGRDEYSFYFTSFLTAGVFQHFNGKQIGDRVWLIDGENLECFNIAGVGGVAGKVYELVPGSTSNKPQIISLSEWLRVVQKAENVFWSDTNQSFRQGNISPDWSAYEVLGNSGGVYFIVRNSWLKSYYLAAFLIVMILTSKRQFAKPSLLISIMVVSQLLQYFSSPIYVAVTGGVFAGAGISLVLTLIRFSIFDQNKTNPKTQNESSQQIPQTQPN
ncbi:MAG: hypothetical protein LBH59_05800 [Planctomycetaceae bacterium]|jgi:hypothetical protein|nr:hypothetical protein [Planctomycetaceae bacterium]